MGLISSAQVCNLVLRGEITDQATGEALEFANIYLEEQESGTITDENGRFTLSDICRGEVHLKISHIGCEPQAIFFTLSRDTFIQVSLDHHSELLHTIEVEGEDRNYGVTQIRRNIQTGEILDAQGQSLGDLISHVPGVNQLKTGNTISKPVIHGLYGNRITIVQHGLNLSSQRWGNDHAPEVGMVGMDRISVVKGVDAIQMGSEGLGGAVILESNPVVSDPHLHGWVNYKFRSNGAQHSMSGHLKNRWKGLSWKATTGFDRSGDTKAPDYFLTNTGVRGYHADLSLYHEIGKNSDIQLNYSFFRNENGILRGAHLGNISDLEAAISREEPFFTQDDFSYDINAPRQEVAHHLLSLGSLINFNDSTRLKIRSGLQYNHRHEFDVRRGGRSSLPSLDLRLLNQQNSVSLIHESKGWTLQSGVETAWSSNNNDPETGIQPLIPDYIQVNSGAFVTAKRSIRDWVVEGGARYDFRYFSVAIAPLNSTDDIQRFKHRYHNVMGSVGLRHRVSDDLQWRFNAGLAQRQPNINELYSAGLHQGVAGIEEGDRDLNGETSLKFMGQVSWHLPSHAWLEIGVYTQLINNYIYLQPEDELRLTIRGAYPVFSYVQDDVNISGLDASVTIPLGHSIEWQVTGNLIRGSLMGSGEPLIYMPQDRIVSHIKYQFSGNELNGHLSIGGEYMFRQKRFPEEVDFLPPPDGYFLLNAEAKLRFQLFGEDVTFFTSANNILNTRYRNYLNRWRYFSDEMGFDLSLGGRWHF